MKNKITPLSELGNNQVQDILEEIGMLDENGLCPYTVEEIFKSGMEYAIQMSEEWWQDNFSYTDEICEKYNNIREYRNAMLGD